MTWKTLGAVAPEDLTDTRIQLHHAVQLLHRFGGAYAAHVEDWSHTAATWDAATGAFVSAPADGRDVRVAVTPEGFSASVLVDGVAVTRVEMSGRTRAHVRAAVSAALEAHSDGIKVRYYSWQLTTALLRLPPPLRAPACRRQLRQ